MDLSLPANPRPTTQTGGHMAAIDPNAPAATTPRKARELLPAGPYMVSIKWAEKTVSNKGTPRITFTYEVVAGDHKGKTVREDAYLTEGSIWKVQTLAKAAGVKKAFDPDNNRELIDTFVGKQLKIVLSVDDSRPDGQEDRKISAFESLDPEIKRVMDAERKARFGGNTGGNASASSTRTGPIAVESDDEVPF